MTPSITFRHALFPKGSKYLRNTNLDPWAWLTGRGLSMACGFDWEPSKQNAVTRVADSTWEYQAAYELDRNPHVQAWAKNDHLGFEITYMFAGAFQKYRPDYLVRLSDGTMLVVEVKGMNTEKDRTKRRFLDEWILAVNSHGGFGTWKSGLVLKPSDFPTAIEKAAMA